MVGQENRIGSGGDGWLELLSGFVGVRNAQETAAVGKWRGLLSDFVDVYSALQVAVGQPQHFPL
jgi:hypothetical protein